MIADIKALGDAFDAQRRIREIFEDIRSDLLDPGRIFGLYGVPIAGENCDHLLRHTLLQLLQRSQIDGLLQKLSDFQNRHGLRRKLPLQKHTHTREHRQARAPDGRECARLRLKAEEKTAKDALQQMLVMVKKCLLQLRAHRLGKQILRVGACLRGKLLPLRMQQMIAERKLRGPIGQRNFRECALRRSERGKDDGEQRGLDLREQSAALCHDGRGGSLRRLYDPDDRIFCEPEAVNKGRKYVICVRDSRHVL